MATQRAFLGLSLVLAAACSSGRGGLGDDGGRSNGNADSGNNNNNGGDGGNVNANGCSAAAQLVYLIDSDTTLYSFDPIAAKFTTIGQINCGVDPSCDQNSPVSETNCNQPFSMGIDRNATAWVLYSPGDVYEVSTSDASCKKSSRQIGQDGLTNFGMGFASNSMGSTDDTLYVAGGPQPPFGQPIDTSAPSKFASMTVPGMSATTIGQVTGWPELTGNDNGELWGFFPSDSAAPKVAKIDKTSGALGTTYSLPKIEGTPNAWAFAHYGGDYYVFLLRDPNTTSDTSTNVYKVSGMNGTMTTLIPDSGKTIVGAGVSTCAPVTIQ